MTLLSLIITLIVVGVLLWLVTTYIPLDATIKKIIVAVVIIAVVVWLLGAFGLMGNINNIHVGQIGHQTNEHVR